MESERTIFGNGITEITIDGNGITERTIDGNGITERTIDGNGIPERTIVVNGITERKRILRKKHWSSTAEGLVILIPIYKKSFQYLIVLLLYDILEIFNFSR